MCANEGHEGEALPVRGTFKGHEDDSLDPQLSTAKATELSTASQLVGPNPTGALGRVSLAVRAALEPLRAQPPKVVFVGLSGGADSLALTLAAADICSRWGIRLETITVNHGLRPESFDEAVRASETAQALGVGGQVTTVDVAANPGGEGPEAAARTARLDALRTYARFEGGADQAPVLLGHTMDDQAETVLLRLARGSGAGSLRAIDADTVDDFGVRWIRPLLRVRREDTREACRQAGLTWVDDPTNQPDGPWRAADGSALRRAAVRAYALPALAQALGVDPVPALVRTAQLAQADDEALNQWACTAWKDSVIIHRKTGPAPAIAESVEASVEALAALPEAVATRVLHRMAIEAGARPGDLSAGHINAMFRLVNKWHGQGRVALPGAVANRAGRGRGQAKIEVRKIR
ncbi:tRNA lysidine(34) synthetase TilS [Schaalia vaccimaxillae]|uniref:tRNA lysidine(34) synthetase TilS n=1 Tax=Schaalia vaccimaxillae TaxID=183916 RepID=UPI0003B7B82E|nr:tRNA lysidine(34) synthetase TilS [Schaalia vaccimaxillae]